MTPDGDNDQIVAGKGLTVSFRKVVGTTTTVLATVGTNVDGLARPAAYPVVSDGVHFVARAGGVTAWPATSSVDTLVHSTAPCAAQLTMSASATTAGYGDKVTFSGRLTKTVAGATAGAAGERVTIYETPNGTTTPLVLGSAATDVSGNYSVPLPVRVSGAVVARRAASTAYTAAQSASTALRSTPTRPPSRWRPTARQ